MFFLVLFGLVNANFFLAYLYHFIPLVLFYSSGFILFCFFQHEVNLV